MSKFTMLLIAFACIVSAKSQIDEVDPELFTEDHEIQFAEAANFKIDLNNATEEQLASLYFLNSQQIFDLMEHRRQAGNYIDLLELQVIPSFDLQTVRSILPYIKLKSNMLHKYSVSEILFKGDYSLISRSEIQWPRSFSYLDSSDKGYKGSPLKQLLRFDYSFKNTFSYGVQIQKDAGESKYADFFSAYLEFDSDKFLDKVILGDFDINIGQGLICWTGYGIGKGVPPLMIKRISAPIKKYRSSDENHFFRGIALKIKLNKSFHSYTFFSQNRLDASVADIDSSTGDIISFSSIRYSGLHRNKSEFSGRNAVRLRSAGFGMSFRKVKWHLAYNYLLNGFNTIWVRREDFRKWNLWNGKTNQAHSTDYHFHHHNMHFFGELAFSSGIACLNGAIISLHRKYAVSILQRYYSPYFSAYFSTSFSENSSVENESGIYFGQVFNITDRLILKLGIDIFEFPDLSYRSDLPAKGYDLIASLMYEKRRKSSVHIKMKLGRKEVNGNSLIKKVKAKAENDDVSISLRYKNIISSAVEWRSELNLKWSRSEVWNRGTYLSQEIIFKPFGFPLDFIVRLGLFDSNSNSSKIYSRERDVLYGYSAPSYIGKGIRFYIVSKADLGNNVDFWIRYAVVSYPGSEIVTLGSGMGEASNPNAILSNKVSEVKIQFRILL